MVYCSAIHMPGTQDDRLSERVAHSVPVAPCPTQSSKHLPPNTERKACLGVPKGCHALSGRTCHTHAVLVRAGRRSPSITSMRKCETARRDRYGASTRTDYPSVNVHVCMRAGVLKCVRSAAPVPCGADVLPPPSRFRACVQASTVHSVRLR